MNMQGGASGGDTLAEKLLKCAQYVAVAAFGLMPVIFFPSAAFVLGYTKVFIAAVATFIAVVFFAFSVLRRGTFTVQMAYPIVVLWFFAIASVVSALFSGDFRDSFWGTEVGPHTALFACLIALVATVWTFVGNNKKVLIHLYILLMASGVALALFEAVRLFLGADTLSFGIFGGSLVLTPFGEWNSLAVFFGLLTILSLTALEQLPLKQAGKAIFLVVIVTSLFMLGIINFIAVFVVLALVSLIVVIYSLTRGRFSLSQPLARSQVSVAAMSAAMGTLIVSVIFIIGGSAVGALISGKTGISYIEVRPSLQATSDIARQVYAHDPVLGIGPNRFADAWRLYHDVSINSTIFWNTNFQSGYGHAPTVFVTHGVLGGSLWLAFLVSFIVFGFRSLFRAEESDRMWYFITLSSFIASCYLWGIALLYVPNSTLLLLAATTTGIFFAGRQALIPSSGRSFEVMRNQRMAFATISATVVVVVLSVGGLYTIGRHYAANYIFMTAYFGILQGGDEGRIMNGILQAFDLSRDDLFAAQISRYQSDKMLAILNSGQGGEAAQADFEAALTNAVGWGQMATSLDGNDPDNWTTLGRAYAAAVPLGIPDSYKFTHEALMKAQQLDPKNPIRFIALAELELLNQNTAEARNYVSQAIALKSNSTEAIYLLSQIDITEGHVADAIEATRAVATLDSGNPVRYFQLGVLEIADKRFRDAAVSLERAVALNADYSNARYYLSFVYDSLGRASDAKRELEEVLRMNPGNEDVTNLLAKLSRGERITENIGAAPGGTSARPEEPVKETSETTAGDEPVTSGSAPDTPLLSPVNTDTETPKEEG